MRIVFMGTPDFSVPTLQALVDAGGAFFRLQNGCRQRADKYQHHHGTAQQLVFHSSPAPLEFQASQPLISSFCMTMLKYSIPPIS